MTSVGVYSTHCVRIHIVSEEKGSHVIIRHFPSTTGQVFKQTVEVILEMLLHRFLRQ